MITVTLVCPTCKKEFDIQVEDMRQVPETVKQSGERKCPACA